MLFIGASFQKAEADTKVRSARGNDEGLPWLMNRQPDAGDVRQIRISGMVEWREPLSDILGDASDCRFFRSSSLAERESVLSNDKYWTLALLHANQSCSWIFSVSRQTEQGAISSGDDAMCGSRRG